MNLSELQAIVDSMRKARMPDNPDPEVEFWLTDEVEIAVRTDPHEPFMGCVLENNPAHENRTPDGDFSWPLNLKVRA